jgi:hypothetical protein
LTSLAIITILTKEGSVQAGHFSHIKVEQVLKMVIMGCVASAAVCLLIWPISAQKQFDDSFKKATSHLGDMMTIITRSFLSGSEKDLKNPAFVDASEQYKNMFKTLVKAHGEAKFEHYALGTEKVHHLQSKLVKCLERLALDISGLRSAATTQFSLLNQESLNSVTPLSRSMSFDLGFSPISSETRNLNNRLESHAGGLESIEEVPNESSSLDDDPMLSRAQTIPGETQSNTTAGAMFAIFISHLGPPMKSLAYTLGGVLDELPYGSEDENETLDSNQFRRSLVDANELFTRARREALTLVYENKVPTKTRSMEVAADYEEVAASCGYFSSSLQDLAEDTIMFLDILQELKDELDQSSPRRSWNWILVWRKWKQTNARWSGKFKHQHYTHILINRVDQSVLAAEIADQGVARIPRPLRHYDKVADSEKPIHEQPFYHRIWKAFRFFRRDDIKYAIKVGIGAILYAMWSFIPATRPIYSHFRGEWGLLSYMLVCSMTIGSSNTTGFQRFFGTCIGAVCAIVAWIASRDNPFVLAFFGWLVSLGCFYIIVGQGKGPMGRFILLTYNLSALYAYSLSVKDEEDDEDEGGISPEIWEIVLHRVVAVWAGCVWGIIITRGFWAISARRKLKNGIAILWFRMGLIWKRDPLTILIDESNNASNPNIRPSYMDIRESLELQRFLTHLDALRKAATSEFEFKGPFPDKTYAKLLQSTSRMLDSFHAMNVVIMKDVKATPGEAELLRYTKQERVQLSSRISHLFSVLASSFKLEYPLNDALPNIEHTRDRLLAKIFEFRKSAEASKGREEVKDEDYELLYCYGKYLTLTILGSTL